MAQFGGLDLSLTSTGMAVAAVGPSGLVVETKLATSSAPPKKQSQDLLLRFERQTNLVADIIDFVGACDVVVVEGLFSSGQVGGAQIDRSGLWWRTVGALLMRGVHVHAVSPTAAKKFFTGAGNADKGTMVRRATKLYPDWEPSTATSSEDEADALALLTVGLAAYDQAENLIEMNADRTKMIDKVRAERAPIGETV